MPEDVVIRARQEFDALIVDGKKTGGMTGHWSADAAARHALPMRSCFANTLPLNSELVTRLPASVRVGATSSVGFDHIDVSAAKERGPDRDEYAWGAD